MKPDTETPNDSRYECLECGNRYEESDDGTRCPSCGGHLRDITNPSER